MFQYFFNKIKGTFNKVSLKVKSLTIENKTKIKSMRICTINYAQFVVKFHKNSVDGYPAFRRIPLASGTPTYKIVKFFVPIVTDLASHEYSVKGSYDFTEKILQENSDCFTAILNITLLFTSISLDETMNICLNESFNEKSCFKS